VYDANVLLTRKTSYASEEERYGEYRIRIKESASILKEKRENKAVTLLKGAAIVVASIFGLGYGGYAAHRKLLGRESVVGRKVLRANKETHQHFAKAKQPVAIGQQQPQQQRRAQAQPAIAPAAIQQPLIRHNVVCGLGPVGLAVALEACRADSKKRPVIAFTNRSAYTRRQILRLETNILEYLESLLGKDEMNYLRNDKKNTIFLSSKSAVCLDPDASFRRGNEACIKHLYC